MQNAVHYTIIPKDLAAHLYEVSLTVIHPDPAGQIFSLPAWIPGSYMIREFARNIVQISAESGGKKIALKKRDKHTWVAAPTASPLILRYEVYAWDLSVRAAHLDQTHGFYNGTSVFLSVEGQEHLPHTVDIQRPDHPDCKKWRVATSLPELKAKRYGFGTYIASDYDELIDHPVEMGDFALGTFKAHGISHDVVITGRVPKLDMERLTTDLQKICATQIAFFEPIKKRAPMDRYVFMTMAIGDGHGGLEHRASTALVCPRSQLPVKGQAKMSDAYQSYLGLCSHEYFHTWNVKRIKPAVFAPYALSAETHTPLLWLFEGCTSYYEDLMLVRSGIIDEAGYFKLLTTSINGLLRGTGRRKQSVADSSFDAWTKYYRQDENSPNAIVSYYTKGALIGLSLDLTIRSQTKGKKSLDDVMRALWQRYGRDFYSAKGGQGVTPEGVENLFEEISGLSLKREMARWLRGTEELPLAQLLSEFAVRMAAPAEALAPSFGVRTTREGNDCKLANVFEKGAAHRAGMSAGDVLLAVDGLRVSATNLDTLIKSYQLGDKVHVHAFRRDELMEFTLKLSADTAPPVTLQTLEKPVAGLRLRQAWLGG